MARRKKRQNLKLSEQMTRKEYLRQHKDRRQQRTLLAVLAPVLVLVGIILAVGAYREIYQKARIPVASVNAQTISATTFTKRLAYERRQFINYVASFLQYAGQTEPATLMSLMDGQRANLPQQTVSNLIDEALIRQEAERRSITVTDDEVAQKIDDDLATQIAPVPEATVAEASEDEAADGEVAAADGITVTEGITVTDEVTATEGITDTGGVTVTDEITATEGITDTATSSPEELDQAFEDTVQPFLELAGLTRRDFEEIVRASLYREKLSEALGAEVPITATQVEVEYLLFEDESTATEAAAALDDGKAWSALVEQYRRPDTPAPEADATTEEAEPDAAADESAPEEAAAEAAEADASEAVTASETITLTGALTDTQTEGAAAPTSTDRPTTTPAPSPTPDPYAQEVGERDWFTRKELIDNLTLTEDDADAVLAMAKGDVSDPLTSGTRSYILHILDVDADRELPADELETLREGALDAWLTEAKAAAKIDQFPLEGLVPDEPEWFLTAWRNMFGEPTPTVDLSALEQPTIGAAEEGPGLAVTSQVPVVVTVAPAGASTP